MYSVNLMCSKLLGWNFTCDFCMFKGPLTRPHRKFRLYAESCLVLSRECSTAIIFRIGSLIAKTKIFEVREPVISGGDRQRRRTLHLPCKPLQEKFLPCDAPYQSQKVAWCICHRPRLLSFFTPVFAAVQHTSGDALAWAVAFVSFRAAHNFACCAWGHLTSATIQCCTSTEAYTSGSQSMIMRWNTVENKIVSFSACTTTLHWNKQTKTEVHLFCYITN